jgi:hypothetical protein
VEGGKGKADNEQAQIAALNGILDRGYGKPTQAIVADPKRPLVAVTVDRRPRKHESNGLLDAPKSWKPIPLWAPQLRRRMEVITASSAPAGCMLVHQPDPTVETHRA